MKKAKLEDKEKVVHIICESFEQNPHIDFIIKNDKKRPRRMKAMAEYAFDFGLRREGVILSDDGEGVAIIFPYDYVKMNMKEYWMQAKLAIRSFTLKRTLMVNKLESEIRSKRPSKGNFLYMWFLGVSDKALGSSAAKELIDYAFELSTQEELPICCETSLARNNKIYKRFGFEDYEFFETACNKLKLWYMCRPVMPAF